MFASSARNTDEARCHSNRRSMPSSSRDDDLPRTRRRQSERERDPDSPRDKQRSSISLGSPATPYKRRPKSKERERKRDSTRSTTAERAERPSRKTSIVVPEMDRRASTTDVRPKTSYPNFSKAHSREILGSREDILNRPLTPEATDISQEKERRRNSTPANGINPLPSRTPPSPPLTVESQDMKRSRSGGSMKTVADQAKSDMESGRKSAEGTPRGLTAKNKAATSSTNIRKETRFAPSDISSMPGTFPEDERRSTPNSSYRRTESTGSQPTSSVTDDSNPDSDATSIPEERKEERKSKRLPPEISTSIEDHPGLASESEPKTPTPASPAFPHDFPLKRNKTPIIEVSRANAYVPLHSTTSSLDPKTPMTAIPPPPPPPPPPLVTSAQNTPRVDYLLKNGGLPSLIPRRLVSTQHSVQPYSTYQSPAIGLTAPIEEYAKTFSPLHKRLEDYLHVLRNNGSLAVATGYKSVARRLLDKLSQVFARDISSQRCDCVVCKTTPQPNLSDEEDSGISWGEILELVSGRRELPQWPPFTIQPDDSGLGMPGSTQAPMQKLDIDVPEEYRDHYIRQNQKTKKAVQNWLAQQPEFPSSPPEEADEDTLMFAMMTKLDSQQRNYFIALMHGQSSINSIRAPTPSERPAAGSAALRKASKALQRLYRLIRPPRDCESAMYLLNNPHLHGMLATLAEVNEQEWDILVSGRFDGFLWSGADAPFPPSVSGYNTPISRGPSRGPYGGFPSRNTTPFSGLSGLPPSRNQTPFSPLRNVMSPDITPQQHPPPATSVFPSRGPTPAVNGSNDSTGVTPPPPVQLDEDTEIAILAEVERNLFNDMERLEDAFEILHSRAELVRQLLRERSAGLSMQAQFRRGSGAETVGIRLDTPASANTDFEQDADDEDGLEDLASLAPDDSASQISINRDRKRHRKRHTPAPPVLEEGEDGSLFEEQTRSAWYSHGGRRSKY